MGLLSRRGGWLRLAVRCEVRMEVRHSRSHPGSGWLKLEDCKADCPECGPAGESWGDPSTPGFADGGWVGDAVRGAGRAVKSVTSKGLEAAAKTDSKGLAGLGAAAGMASGFGTTSESPARAVVSLAKTMLSGGSDDGRADFR